MNAWQCTKHQPQDHELPCPAVLPPCRIVLLILLFFEWASLGLCIVMGCMKLEEQVNYDRFDDATSERRTIAMGRLRADIEKAARSQVNSTHTWRLV